MNILFHHRTRGRGAEGAHIRGVTKGLRQLGHQVTVVSFPGADPETEEVVEAVSNPPKQANEQSGFAAKIGNLTKHAPPFLFELLEMAYNLIVVPRVFLALRRSQSTIVYERYSLFMFATVWFCRVRRLPCILEVNDSCLVHRVRPLVFSGLARTIERWVFRNATGLVFISSAFHEIAAEQFGDIAPSVISPNAVDLDLFPQDIAATEEVRAALQLTDKIVIGYVGAFVHWHGIDWFVKEFGPKLSEYPNVVLLLVGDGVVLPEVQEFVDSQGLGEQVLLPGRVAHADVADYIAAMDFGILPDSNDYGSPMKLFEFMAMGRGMVAPDFGPVDEVIEDNETSWLFAANDKAACVTRVLDVIADPASQKRVGKNAREFIVNQRQWRHNAEQLLSLLPATS